MTIVVDVLEGAPQQDVVLIPMLMPGSVFTFLNEAAIKEGKTVSQLVTEVLQRTVAEMAEKHLSEGG